MKKKDQEINKKLIEEIILEIQFLEEDGSIPKTMKNLICDIEKRLQNQCTALEISNILYELEELTNNNNVPQFCRSAVWSLISKLEKLKETVK
ncbi:MAG: UPF0147 family protein [Candidatus ainarchaeum sp.]|nr:UPF0147 family protein [Candidatus ainarchaeum sp.]